MSIQRLFLVALAVLTAAACAEESDPVSAETHLSMKGAGHRVGGSSHVRADDGIRDSNAGIIDIGQHHDVLRHG